MKLKRRQGENKEKREREGKLKAVVLQTAVDAKDNGYRKRRIGAVPKQCQSLTLISGAAGGTRLGGIDGKISM